MIYLRFIEPRETDIQVSREALITRIGSRVVVKVDNSHTPVVVGSDRTVSRNHARIYMDTGIGKCYIQDLGSLNGTRINGKLIEGWKPKNMSDPVELGIDSIIEVGVYTVFKVEFNIERPSERVQCGLLRFLREHVTDLINEVLRVKLGKKEDISRLSSSLEYLISRNIYVKILENASRDSTHIIKQHLHIIQRDPWEYLSLVKLIDELENTLQKIKDNINREIDLCYAMA